MSSETTTTRRAHFRAERTEEHVVMRFPHPRRFLRAFLPEEAVKHLYAARREQLARRALDRRRRHRARGRGRGT